jgi:hypothetical protein
MQWVQNRPAAFPPQLSPQADVWARRMAAAGNRQQAEQIAAAWRRRMATTRTASTGQSTRGRATRRVPIIMPGQWRRGRMNRR